MRFCCLLGVARCGRGLFFGAVFALTVPNQLWAWTSPSVVYSEVGSTTRTELGIAVGGGLATGWGVVWTVSSPIGFYAGVRFTRTPDNGANWTSPILLCNAVANTSDEAADPVLNCALNGTWIAAWDACIASGTQVDIGRDIYFTRSTNAGASWGAAQVLNSDFADGTRINSGVTLSTDGAGTWLAAWQVLPTTNTAFGSDPEIALSRSVDDGVSWSAPVIVNPAAATDAVLDLDPVLAVDSGTWMLAWEAWTYTTASATNLSDRVIADIVAMRSVNAGVSWADFTTVSLTGSPDAAHDVEPAIVGLGGGSWLVAWSATGGSAKIVASRSSDDGVSFAAPDDVSVPVGPTLFEAGPTLFADGTQVTAIWDTMTTAPYTPSIPAHKAPAYAQTQGVPAPWSTRAVVTELESAKGAGSAAAMDSSANAIVVWGQYSRENPDEIMFVTANLGNSYATDWAIFE